MKTNHQRGFIARYSDQWWYKSRLTAKPDKRCDVVNYHEQLAALDCRPVRVARVKVRRRAEAMHEWRGHHYTPSDPVFYPVAPERNAQEWRDFYKELDLLFKQLGTTW